MRILVLSQYWPFAANPISGIFMQEQVEEYVRQGNEIVVIAPVQFGRPGLQRPLRLQHGGAEVWSPRYLAIPGLQRLPASARALGLSWMTRNFARSVLDVLDARNIADNFDVIHANGIVFAGLSLPHIRAKLPVPSVITIHGEDPMLTPVQNRDLTRRELSEMWQCVSRIALVGTPLKIYVGGLYAAKEKLVIVPNGSKLATYEDKSSHAGKIDDEHLKLISVSNLNHTKGVHINIEAMNKLVRTFPDKFVSYTIIGDGPERRKLEKLVKNYGLEASVHFAGRLPHNQTIELVRRADIFSLPSYVEAFGIVYIEAMASGIAVVGCEGTGASDIITNGETGLLVKQQDATDLRWALERLSRDPAFRLKMGRNARLKATQYSWSANVRNYVEIFEGIVGSP
jgi:glycosyltransferase involved in cell wall biosynthesis